MNLNFKNYWASILLAGTLFFLGCGNDSNETSQSATNDSLKKGNLTKNAASSSGSPKIFAMPAPLQIAAAIKNANTPFLENLMIPSKSSRIYSSDYLRALNLGIYTVDIGYAIVYNQRQPALNYHKTIDRLVTELNIVSDIIPQSRKRFERNIENTDSLCVILLETCNGIHEDFQVNKQEHIGWYSMAGAYIEGLYLTLNTKELQKTKAFENLLGQQKLFLDNILEVSNYMEKRPEFDDLYQKLGSLQEAYAPINVTVKDNNTANLPVISCEYTADQVKNIQLKVTEIRNSIIK